MNVQAKILIAALLVATPSAARSKVDVIVMSNGDRITGEIKSLNAGVLRVDLDYVDGSIALHWMKVARIESPQLFIVRTQDGDAGAVRVLEVAAEAAADRALEMNLLHRALQKAAECSVIIVFPGQKMITCQIDLISGGGV